MGANQRCQDIGGGFQPRLVQAAQVCMTCYWSNGTEDEPPEEWPSAEEALVGILRHAPPAMRTCTLALAPLVDGSEQTWGLDLAAQYRTCHSFWADDSHTDFCARAHKTSYFESARVFACKSRPFAREASINVRVDRQSQEMRFVRRDGIS